MSEPIAFLQMKSMVAVLVLLVAACGGSAAETTQFELSREESSTEIAFLQALDQLAPEPMPAHLRDAAVILGSEACAQFSYGSDEQALARAFEYVGWTPNPDQWAVILLAATYELCPEWTEAVGR